MLVHALNVALTWWTFPPKSFCILVGSQIVRTERDILGLQHAQDILYAIRRFSYPTSVVG